MVEGSLLVIIGIVDPKNRLFFVKNNVNGLKIWLNPFFDMRNPKKLVSSQSVDPPDSKMGGP